MLELEKRVQKDKTLEKIIKFFKKIECPAETIFKRNLNGELLQEYAVIYSGEDIMFCDKKNEKFKFEERQGIDLLAFYSRYFGNKERLLKRLEQNGYILCNLQKNKT